MLVVYDWFVGGEGCVWCVDEVVVLVGDVVWVGDDYLC